MTDADVRIPFKDRQPFLHLRYGCVDVQDGAVVLTDVSGSRLQVPVASLACLMLEPGTSITHAAVAVCAASDCLIIWCGEAGARFYAAGQPGGARADKLLWQLGLASQPKKRLRVVREMFRRRFGDDVPDRRGVDQLRGVEGSRVRERYAELAAQFGVTWTGRKYDPTRWARSNDVNRAISAANAALYALTEAAVLIAGYSTAVGFLHSGKPLSFVYDIADLYKFETSVPVAFATVRDGAGDVENEVRRRLRASFGETKLLERIIPDIEAVLDAGVAVDGIA